MPSWLPETQLALSPKIHEPEVNYCCWVRALDSGVADLTISCTFAVSIGK